MSDKMPSLDDILNGIDDAADSGNITVSKEDWDKTQATLLELQTKIKTVDDLNTRLTGPQTASQDPTDLEAQRTVENINALAREQANAVYQQNKAQETGFLNAQNTVKNLIGDNDALVTMLMHSAHSKATLNNIPFDKAVTEETKEYIKATGYKKPVTASNYFGGGFGAGGFNQSNVPPDLASFMIA